MFCPRGHCLCRTLQNEGTRIWGDLQDADQFNTPMHEDTVTQTLALELNRRHPAENRVHLFQRSAEAKNGSDFLWVFFDSGRSRYLPVAVQAKRLYPSGRYEAFKAHQVNKLELYARSIGSFAIYLTYNYPPVRHGLYKGLKRSGIHRLVLALDHARDFSLLYFHASHVGTVKDGALKPADIASVALPMWTAFCICSHYFRLDKLHAALAELRGVKLPLEGRDAPQPRELTPALRRWMNDENVSENELEQLFNLDSGGEGFKPRFILGTILR